MSIANYADGVLIEEWDDDTRTYTDHRTGTTRPYTQAESDAADQAFADRTRMSDLMARVEALEAWRATFAPDPDEPDPEDASLPSWSDLSPANVWPAGTLLVDDGVVYRNVSGVPLTTPPSGFPGSPDQWSHLFQRATSPEPEPEPEPEPGAPAWTEGVAYEVGDLVMFSGVKYRAQQAHTSQPGWTPTAVPALWTPA